ncbi:MAG: hypothetical protein AUK47_19895 [Deltaproteobacteria bacterium CG2_30_63_29]|nr:MAG: hypothetical protein AUK47_19895 [Deltaproteobacteria bacterium CG2_30_63_29]PIV98234.1 MAG: hypothetical protein COW42_15845 [Deltaproteobacteria bacterium CG17_big_fil_post_rev_8_21_14_2_50_63_7]PJB42748.1 MAG: hypothetical protein CO108_11225 [Deltaproteobacteria bacterium CG_4_9_14_3_um_filter_63_12]
MAKSDARQIVWRVFCPRCLTPHEGHAHQGMAAVVAKLDCLRCRKPFEVTTSVGRGGMPVCNSAPHAIRKPELIEDNRPFDLP